MSEPLRVAYTLEQCWHDVPGGTATAALRVARELDARDDVELVGVSGRHRSAPEEPYTPMIPVRQLPIARPWLYETWNRLEWPRIERATGPVDLCHSTLAIPAATSAPHVVTVHDVAFVHAPQRFSTHGVRVMRAGLERCRDADLLLCPSSATADDLSALGFDIGRIRVVPWGVDPAPVDDVDRQRVQRAYSLPDRFVLFVGTLEPRKNLARLADAVSQLGDLPLVVVGAAGWGEIELAVGCDMTWLGFVPDRDLAVLYDRAAVFAYPSLQEGFGLPILEAMSAGTPVVTSRGSSTEEVAGGAAVLVDPLDTASIAAGIDAALKDPSLAARGRSHAATRSWTQVADATAAAYREVVR